MGNSIDTIRKAFQHLSTGRLPRGELWLGTDLLKKASLEDDLSGHLTLIERLGQDILCLPLSNEISMNKALGYRYFSLKDLEEASRMSELFLISLIDGPFQRLAEKKGLMKILTRWKWEKHEFAEEYGKEQAEVGILVKQCLELPVDAVIIADDLAGEHSTYISPHDAQDLFSSFYTEVVAEIHNRHSYALFHSCGKITPLIPQLISYRFDGLAAIQHRVNNLISIKEEYGSTLTLMAGIEAEMLEAGRISLSTLKEYERLVRSLTSDSSFIICSSCGLYSGKFLERIQELYWIADELCKD